MGTELPTKVQLGAKEYQLRFTIADGLELQRRLGRKGFRIMRDLVGINEEGVFNMEIDLEALVTCLQVGIRHVRKAPDDLIVKWIQEHVDNGNKIGDLYGPVFNALNQQRAFGFRLESPDEGDDSGKAETPSETS